jgi:hypothetical protein
MRQFSEPPLRMLLLRDFDSRHQPRLYLFLVLIVPPDPHSCLKIKTGHFIKFEISEKI